MINQLIAACLAGTLSPLTWGEAALPPCQGKQVQQWHNCSGMRSFPDGRYSGEFQAGKLHGLGTFIFSQGDQYVGEWREDRREGRGTYTHPNGSKYVGNWKAGKPHGLGSARFPNKTTYVGEYVDGKREGEGVLYAADGTVQVSGAWKDDQLTTPYVLDTTRFPLNRFR
ncbi:MAG: hypothetical protein EBZ03_08195 [Betaproteobacteria bacterium]|nr:hypothetical protein [Pseudomonadota bacterium]NBO13383.1 hypothetical protein [Betaproteobacteria bacterium]NBP11620.1 hypothetical protein [Betaproteobacteria bacterium]NBP61978.1 hypothetical protein [Betaproteobacteria bacterium]NBQ08997.1 hypothetical protein [Betaproteobacteria bacterium]